MLLFIYGTLKRNEYNNQVLKGAKGKFISEGETVLTHSLTFEAYPELHKDGDEFVKGEVWEIPEEHIDFIDTFEGHPTFYKRDIIAIRTAKEFLICHTYFKV